MQDLVSMRQVRMMGLLASMTVVWAVSLPHGFTTGLVWGSLGLTAVVWLAGLGLTRSIFPVPQAVEASRWSRSALPVAASKP
jgi:hypothetical protein